MSRTGVGCRVVIDGKQIDDGCFNWYAGTYGDPWTTTRTNLFGDPRSVTSGTGYWTGAPSVPTKVDGSALGEAYAQRFTNPATGAQRGGPRVVNLLANTTYTVRFRARGSVERGTWAISYRNNLASSSNQTSVASGVAIGLTAQDYEFVFTMGATPGNTNSVLGLVNANGVAAEWFEMTRISVELGNTAGQGFFDGASTPTNPGDRYVWNGAANASTSSLQRGTWIPVNTDNYIPEGLSADEGLRVVWGRTTTNEQPSPSTCTFSVTDDPGNLYFANLRIGSSVFVYADSTVHGGSTLPAFHDPDFESEVRAVTSNSTVGRGNRHVETGSMAAVMKPLVADRNYAAQFPPGTIQPAGTNPNAWDDIPHLSPGQTWHLSVRVWVPGGLTVTARPLIYSGPYAGAASALPVMGAASGEGWHTIEADVSPGVALGWMGVQIEASGGLSWAATPDEWLWSTIDQNLEWRDLSDVYLDRVEILAPEGGTTVTILVFGGRVTDLDSKWNGSGPQIGITAVDFLGDLGNRYVGDEPWLLEPLQTRVVRILSLARAGDEPAITADVATTIANVPVTWEDVDHRAASGLLTDLAQSVDGVLWSATHIVSGPYVKIEDPGQRPPLYQLALVGGQVVIASIDVESLPVDQRPLDLSACDVLRDPVTFTLDVADIATRAVVSWQEQTVDDDGLPSPTERNYSEILANREAQYGTRNISITTLLTTQDAAETVAERLLARNTGQWRMEGLEVADLDFNVPDEAAAQILLALLDGVRRGGLPVRVTELPSWSPIGATAPAYVEGGDYTFSGGGWTLALTISRATGLGANAQWDEIPRAAGWVWDSWQPGITWDALRGVAAPEE